MATKDENYYAFLEEAYKKATIDGVWWSTLCVEYAKRFNEYLTKSALRHRALNYMKHKNTVKEKCLISSIAHLLKTYSIMKHCFVLIVAKN